MADSTYLKKVVEPFIVQWVSRRIGVVLQPRLFPVGPRTDGTLVHFEFDGVSEDGRIGLLVSSSQSLKDGATRKLHVDASNILRAGFQRRIMVFVSNSVRKNFLNKCDGLLELSKIEMLVCNELPPKMRPASLSSKPRRNRRSATKERNGNQVDRDDKKLAFTPMLLAETFHPSYEAISSTTTGRLMIWATRP